MSDTNFTPGKWEVRIEQVVPTSKAVCYTVATDDYDVVSPRLGIRSEADANLIAASKALYEALYQVVELVKDPGGYCMQHPAVQAGIDALDKSRGEES